LEETTLYWIGPSSNLHTKLQPENEPVLSRNFLSYIATPTLVLQVTYAGARRPGYKATDYPQITHDVHCARQFMGSLITLPCLSSLHVPCYF